MIRTCAYTWHVAPARRFTRADAELWALSVSMARPHFEKLVLLTNERGMEQLAPIALPWDETSAALEDIPASEIWALGKIAAHGEMAARGRPFVHLDHDVLLWSALPERILSAGICAERPEVAAGEGTRMYPLNRVRRMPLPPHWREALRRPAEQQIAYNAGLFGGSELPAIAAYAAESVALASEHAAAWERLSGTHASVILEQYAMGIHFGDRVETLFAEQWPAPAAAAEVGYTHVFGHAKKLEWVRWRVRRILAARFPEVAERVRAAFAAAV